MAQTDLTTTVVAIEIIDESTVHVLVVTNDIRDNYVSELKSLKGERFDSVEVLLRVPEWLTGFTSPRPDLSYVSRWDDTLYEVAGSVTTVRRPCEAMTRVTPGPDGQVFATCYGGLVQKLSQGKWEQISLGRDVDLFEVLPTGEEAFYVCGDEGTLAHCAGRRISFFDLPTDMPLFALARDSSDQIVAGGEGVLFRGGGEQWEALDADDITFHHARRHQKSVLLGGGERGLYKLRDSTLTQVHGDVYAYYVATCDEVIATCGDNKAWVVRPDGRILLEFDHLAY